LLIKFTLNKPKQAIIECFTNSEKFVATHPIIFKMIDLGNNNFKVYEKLMLGFIPYSFTYFASIIYDAQTESIGIKATIKAFTHIEMQFTFIENGTQTLVEERLKVKSILPIQGIVKKVICEQHRLFFKNIDSYTF
jgi:carbon monoxide dehydrogenase subunit G